MAQNDRWTLKILALPIFTDDFAQAILATPLANLAFVIANSRVIACFQVEERGSDQIPFE